MWLSYLELKCIYIFEERRFADLIIKYKFLARMNLIENKIEYDLIKKIAYLGTILKSSPSVQRFGPVSTL